MGLFNIEYYYKISDIKSHWLEIERTGHAYVFQKFSFAEHFLETIGAAENLTPVIVEVRGPDDRPLLLLPLALKKWGPITILEWLGGRVADYHAPLLAPSASAALTADRLRLLWRDILARLPAVDVIAFAKMPSRVLTQANPVLAMFDSFPETRNAHSATLITDFHRWLKLRKSGRTLQRQRSKFRRLQSIGTLTFSLDPNLNLRQFLEESIIAQKSRRWIETRCRDLFGLPGYREFYGGLIRGEVMPECAHTSALLLDGEPIACHWGLVDRGRFYYILPTYAAGPALRLSPGVHLLMALLEWASGHGVEVFDFTIGDEEYKQDWCDVELPLWRYLEARTWRGRAYVAQQRLRERARQTAWLRDLVRSARQRRQAKADAD